MLAVGLPLAAGLFHGTLSADHIGIGPPTGDASIALVIGPVLNPTGPATVSFDLSGSPQTMGNGVPVDGTPVILFEVGARRGGGPPASRPSGVELRATAPASLQSGPHQIPITDISWTSVLPAGAGYADVISSGQFAPGSQVIDTFAFTGGATHWMGGELTFHFANAIVYPAGNYGGPGSGVVAYTATFVP